MVEIGENNVETDETTKLNKVDPTKATISAEGLYAITVKDTAKNYAPWTTTIYVEAN